MKLLDPKLKYEGSSHVFRHCSDLMSFVRHLSIQLVIALAGLHAQGIIYKDLKATHVFLDEHMRLTLIDFGLAEQLSEDGKSILAGGTLHAMSPEMLVLYTKTASGQQDRIDAAREAVGYAHDFYTIGVLILELIDPNLIKYYKTAGGTAGPGGVNIQQLREYF